MKPEAVTTSAKKRERQAVSRSGSVEELVREVRQASRRIGKERRAVERLLKQARALRAASAVREGRQRALDSALPHMEKVLHHAALAIEEGWADLDTSFSRSDLAEVVATARGRSQRPGRAPGRRVGKGFRPAQRGRRGKPRGTSGRGK